MADTDDIAAPPPLTSAHVQPFRDLLEPVADRERPNFDEHQIGDAALSMAQYVWGFAWRCYWEEGRFRPLMTSKERNRIAKAYISRAKALRQGMLGLAGLKLEALPFIATSFDRLHEAMRGEMEPTYFIGTEGQRRAHVLGTQLATIYERRLTPTAKWVRPGAKLNNRRAGLQTWVTTLSAEMEGTAILLESVAELLATVRGGQESEARYMFGSCIDEYRKLTSDWPEGSRSGPAPLFVCIDGLLRAARALGRRRPIGASLDTFRLTLQAMRRDKGFDFLASYRAVLHDRDAAWIIRTPPAVPELE